MRIPSRRRVSIKKLSILRIAAMPSFVHPYFSMAASTSSRRGRTYCGLTAKLYNAWVKVCPNINPCSRGDDTTNDTHLPLTTQSQYMMSFKQGALTCIEAKLIVSMRTVSCFVVFSSPSSIKYWRKSAFVQEQYVPYHQMDFSVTYRLVGPSCPILVHAL